MLGKEEAREKIKSLVEEFLKYSKEEINSKSENQIKSEFIDPLFEALGWDMRKEAEREEKILRGRADYILRNQNQEVLVIEAKKTNVQLKEEEGKQAVSYAYHRKIKFSVLTNFKQIRVYHALSNIQNIDKNLLFWIEVNDFEKEFEKLWLLSKENFEKKELEKLIPSKDKKTAVAIDERILDDLLQIRTWLSAELKSKRTALKDEYIDEIVQILIDRFIFMRSVEDRKLEAEDFLLKIMQSVQHGETDKNLWALIKDQFVRFDKTYNAKLFANGILEEYGFFSDEILKKVIKTLYSGLEHTQERYMFDLIPGDLFGSIYEQYLGTILAGTEKRVKLDSSSGTRKKMGIYYTPSYIVDYIIKNTVREYLKEKTIDEILEVKILDPACGSGSFLTRAFVEVCNIIQEKLNKKEFSKKWNTFREDNPNLSFSQKSTILKNCIFGVDLDEKAVELAQLNLLLKCLEGESRELNNRRLPNLLENIKCGNSLIDDAKVSERSFNWNAQFPEIFRAGGFDIVVGNPPYVRSQLLNPEDKKYFEKNYFSASNQYDIYILFIEKAILNLKKNGLIGFITPNKFLVSDYGLKLREFIFENTNLKYILDVSQLEVFDGIGTYPIIFILEKNNKKDKIKIIRNIKEESIFSEEFNYELLDRKNIEEHNKKIISLEAGETNKPILKKVEKNSILLGEIAEVYRGVIPPNQENYISKEKSNFSKKAIRGRDIKKYNHKWNGEYIKYDKKLNIKKSEKFEGEKIILPRTVLNLIADLDIENLNLIDRVYYIKLNENKVNIKFLLGLINSKLIDFYYKSYFGASHLQGNYLDLKGVDLVKIPIRLPSSLQQEQKIISLVNQMLELQKQFHDDKIAGNEKERLKQQINNIDYEIDQEIYKLYELTDEEIKIVEESLKK